MRKLFKFLKPYTKEAIIAPAFKLLESLFDLAVPLIVAKIINYGIANGDKAYIIRMCIVLFALAAIGLTCALTAQYFAAKAAVGFASDLRSALFNKVMGLSFKQADSYGPSGLLNRLINDINKLQNGVNWSLRLLLRSPFIVFGAMIMAFTVNVKAALVFVVTIPLLFVIVFGVMKITMPMFKNVQKSLDKVTLSTRENLNGVRVIRAFGREADERKTFNEYNEKLFLNQIRAGKYSALTNPLTYAVLNIAVIMILYISGININLGVMAQGDVVALIDYTSQVLIELIKLSNTISFLTSAYASVGRVTEILELPDGALYSEETINSDKESGFAVEFKGVSFTYEGAKEPSLENVNFSVKRGETIGIIGPTGSGKSTLAELLVRFYDVSCGEILINGKNINTYDEESLRKTVGIVLQKASLLKGTIADNLRFRKEDASDNELLLALKVADADAVVTEKGGLLAEVEQGGKNFSGGQRQRLSIARELVFNPDILVLDDSTSALDFATEARVKQNINELRKGKTTFIISQRAGSLKHADKILVLDEGEVAGFGSSDELLENCPLYKEIYLTQYER